jgi:hypothetical protein
VLEDLLQVVTASRYGRLVGVRGRRQVGKSRLAEQFAARSGVPYGVIAGMKGTSSRMPNRLPGMIFMRPL